ncbi:MAG: class I SAM-dependent methyltransferase [Bacteroidota bacterium]
MYPLILEQLSPEVALWIPDTEAIKSEYEKLKIQEPNLAFPFWAKIWASSKAMVTFLQEEPHWIEKKNILEIGAGIGVPSFSIAKKAANITISDYASEAVILANKNIVHLNVTNVSAIILDWNHIPEHTTADTILLSDTNYEPAAHNKLVLLVEKFINNGSTIILSTPNRLSSTPFIERISKYIYSSKNYKMIENESLVEIAVVVLKQ